MGVFDDVVELLLGMKMVEKQSHVLIYEITPSKQRNELVSVASCMRSMSLTRRQ